MSVEPGFELPARLGHVGADGDVRTLGGAGARARGRLEALRHVDLRRVRDQRDRLGLAVDVDGRDDGVRVRVGAAVGQRAGTEGVHARVTQDPVVGAELVLAGVEAPDRDLLGVVVARVRRQELEVPGARDVEQDRETVGRRSRDRRVRRDHVGRHLELVARTARQERRQVDAGSERSDAARRRHARVATVRSAAVLACSDLLEARVVGVLLGVLADEGEPVHRHRLGLRRAPVVGEHLEADRVARLRVRRRRVGHRVQRGQIDRGRGQDAHGLHERLGCEPRGRAGRREPGAGHDAGGRERAGPLRHVSAPPACRSSG